MKKISFLLFVFVCIGKVCSQTIEQETEPPYHIKTICFHQRDSVALPFFRLGEPFELQFDDLY
ncbi:MAG TPA: DUF5103 domain-containing protein, partial [Flavobacterium sp.]|nr:DUF5103 domain-containing protein [Flavobacterium sp.]